MYARIPTYRHMYIYNSNFVNLSNHLLIHILHGKYLEEENISKFGKFIANHKILTLQNNILVDEICRSCFLSTIIMSGALIVFSLCE